MEKAAIEELARQALDDAGVAAPADLALRPLRAAPLASAFVVLPLGLELEVFPVDLEAALLRHPDHRMKTIARALRVPPHLVSFRARIDAARPAVALHLPRVLAEGRTPGGGRFALSEPPPGDAWDPRFARTPARRRELAARLGRLARELHAAPVREDAGGEDLASRPGAHAEVLFAVVEHLPGYVAGDRAERGRLLAACERILSRLGRLDLGPAVLAHGDLHPASLSFDADGDPVGLRGFGLSTPGPRALDFRAATALDHLAFFRGYGLAPAEEDDAHWLGTLYEAMWGGLAMVAVARLTTIAAPLAFWEELARELHYHLRVLDDDALRTGPASARVRLRRELGAAARARLVAAAKRRAEKGSR